MQLFCLHNSHKPGVWILANNQSHAQELMLLQGLVGTPCVYSDPMISLDRHHALFRRVLAANRPGIMFLSPGDDADSDTFLAL